MSTQDVSVWIGEDGAGIATNDEEIILRFWEEGNGTMEMSLESFGEEPTYRMSPAMLRALGAYLVAQADRLDALERIRFEDEVRRGLLDG